MEPETLRLIEAVIAALLVGLTKTGVPGLGILMVPLLAAAVGTKASTGYLLPMLLFGDVFAVAYYRRHADWKIILRLLPWVLVGIGVGLFALNKISSEGLTPVFGVLILSMIVLKVLIERGGDWLENHLPHKWWFSAGVGVLAGFTTAIGNIAGSIMGIYLISMGLRKHGFMGTSAWFYLIVNAVKLPFYYGYVGVITAESLMFDLKAAPLILLGVLAGFYVFRVIPQKWFNRIVIGLAAAAALRLLVKGFLM